MGLGGTAKKLQKVANMAEDLYARLNDLREQLDRLRETVEQTNTDVEQIRHEQQVNRALLERMAEQQGIDVNETLESVSTETRQPAPEQERGQDGRRQQDQWDQQGQQGQQRQQGQGSQGTTSDTSPADRTP